MSLERSLHGGCSCGRNTFIIEMPPKASDTAQVIFDGNNSFRTSPLAAHLRVPLAWYHSTTHAFFPDETHPAIRRAYAPSSNSLRHFCGFCGSHLAMWSEAPKGEGEYISLALGSLDGGDLHDLGELGLLPQEEAEKRLSVPSEEPVATRAAPRVGEGLPWFEAMIEGSALGRVKVRRGLEEKDGRRVEWEVVEWTEGGEEAEADSSAGEVAAGGKRKLEDDHADMGHREG
ncbi:hypothetical protein VE01_02863 [Pseudogymnoascus verrucosus]|uniref:CENP-V/GFA domain-containing protein n=1 Tax=Pseudogymnoascus verrucosus TaxID=342668 RepID=A0A1B8GUH1_9PEZI|nr:uncharacterized protein VE01_02863 [Pseudogymnoascus verrucosus]OBT99475.1 hypothetical protein VE01_02863 [Pseudogymnoascus verrucosus]